LVARRGTAGDEEGNGNGGVPTTARHLRPVRPPSSSSSAVASAATDATANRRSSEENSTTGNTAPNSKRVIGARSRRFRQLTQEDAGFGDDEGNAGTPGAASGNAILRPKPPVLPPIHGPNNARNVEDRGRGGINGTGLNHNNNNHEGAVGLDSDSQSGDEDSSLGQRQHHFSPKQRQQQYGVGASFEDVSIIDLQASANANATVYANENLRFNGNVKEINAPTPGDSLETTSGSVVGGSGMGGVASNLEGPVLVRKARVRTVSRRELARHQHHHQATGKGGAEVVGAGGGAEVGVLALDAAEKVPSSITNWRQGKVQNNPTTP